MREDLPRIIAKGSRARGCSRSNHTRRWNPPSISALDREMRAEDNYGWTDDPVRVVCANRYGEDDPFYFDDFLSDIDYITRFDLDDSPKHVPTRPRKGWDYRTCQTYRHATLRKILEGTVGKPWSRTHRNLCQVFRRPDDMRRLKWFLDFELGWGSEFFVDPKSGTLQKRIRPDFTPTYTRPQGVIRMIQSKNGSWITYDTGAKDAPDPLRFAEQEEGIWYVFTYGEHGLDEIISRSYLGPEHTPVIVRYLDRPDISRRWLIAKRQISRKELRAMGVRNNTH